MAETRQIGNETTRAVGDTTDSKWMCRNCGQVVAGTDGWEKKVEVKRDLIYVYWECKKCGKVYWDVVSEIPAPGECMGSYF
jgi:uncharacterized protein with PIN domain